MKTLMGILFLLLMGIHKPLAQSTELENYRPLLAEKQKIKGFERDTGYIRLLIRFANAFYSVNADSLLFYAQKAYGYAETVHYEQGLTRCLSSEGNYYSLMGDYPQMLSYYQQALSLAEKIKDRDRASSVLMDIGRYYLDAQEYDKARANYEQAYRIIKEAGDSLGMAYVLTDIGVLYFVQDNFDETLLFYRQALRIASALKSQEAIAFTRADIGYALCRKGLYKEALGYLLPALQYYQHTGDKLGRMETGTSLVEAYRGLGEIDTALTYALESLSLARETKNKAGIVDAGEHLTHLYERKGDYRNSLKYFKLYKDYSDSLYNEDSRKKIVEQETKYVYEKKEGVLKAQQASENLLHSQHLKSLQLEVSITVLAALFLGAIALILYRSRALKQKSNLRLEVKNNEIALQKAEIEQQAAQLRGSNQQKDQLFSIIAHDLSGPLNSLKALLDFLKEKSLSEVEIAKTINSLKNNVHYTADLVNNLLYWARNQMEGINVQPSQLNVEELSESVLTLFARQAADKKIETVNKLDKGLSVCADKDMMQVVIRNLVSNAIKFCRPGDTITVEQGAISKELVEICVADTGTGIKEEVLLKINKSESITTFGTSSEKGTGLGLLLCREFVEKNKGRFRIESQWGQGSRFYLSLPAQYND
ncbi:MAG TPA: tetratricopeptide repeat protein [Puia sp.]|nr:tetratricopeptide repeat protein [Puia sp.]